MASQQDRPKVSYFSKKDERVLEVLDKFTGDPVTGYHKLEAMVLNFSKLAPDVFYYAAQTGRVDFVRVLFERGAQPPEDFMDWILEDIFEPVDPEWLSECLHDRLRYPRPTVPFGRDQSFEYRASLLSLAHAYGCSFSSAPRSYDEVRALWDEDVEIDFRDSINPFPSDPGTMIQQSCPLLMVALECGLPIEPEALPGLLRLFDQRLDSKRLWEARDWSPHDPHEVTRSRLDRSYLSSLLLSRATEPLPLTKETLSHLWNHVNCSFNNAPAHSSRYKFACQLSECVFDPEALRVFLLSCKPWRTRYMRLANVHGLMTFPRLEAPMRDYLKDGHEREVDLIVRTLAQPLLDRNRQIITALLHLPRDYAPPTEPAGPAPAPAGPVEAPPASKRPRTRSQTRGQAEAPQDRSEGTSRPLEFVDLPRDVQRGILELAGVAPLSRASDAAWLEKWWAGHGELASLVIKKRVCGCPQLDYSVEEGDEGANGIYYVSDNETDADLEYGFEEDSDDEEADFEEDDWVDDFADGEFNDSDLEDGDPLDDGEGFQG